VVQVSECFADGSRFVVTGVSGWVGRALVARLADRLGAGWRDRVALFGSHPRALDLGGLGGAEVRALSSLEGEDTADAYVFHLAFLGKERLDDLSISDFVAQNCRIDDQVLNAFRQGRPRRSFIASSGAAADALHSAKRNGYGLCKLLQEDRFLAWATGSGDVLVGRIFNISGPHINKLNSYALSSCIVQCLDSKSITLKSRNLTYRSYIHIFDVLDMVLSALGQRSALPASPVDLCGNEIVELGDLAARVAAHLGVPAENIIRPAVTLEDRNIYVGDYVDTHALAYRSQLKIRDLSAQIQDTIDYVRAVARPA